MGTTIGGKAGKEIATTGSGHIAPAPPVVSMLPPTPAGPVPAPFPYVAKSSSATGTSDKLTVGGKPVLVEGSAMDIEKPGNQPAAPPGTGDLLTHVVNAKAVLTSGSSRVKVGGKGLCATGDSVVLNVPTPSSKVAQAQGTLIAGVGGGSSGANAASGSLADDVCVTESVAVVSGEVVDNAVDLALPGLIPVVWKRFYRSGRHKEVTPLGHGGWTHGFHQWVEGADEGITLRMDDGRRVPFPRVTLREPAFHRGKRLRLSMLRDGSFEVYSLDTRLTRRFVRLAAGDERAMLREIRDAWGNRVELRYDGSRLARIVDTAGRELRLIHDEAERITRVEVWVQGTAHQAVAYAYVAVDGDLVAATDALGHAERYAYDAWHRMTEKTLTNGVRFHYEYDTETGRCRKAWGDGTPELLHKVGLDVDVQKKETIVHSNPEPRKFIWNDQGAVLREQTYDGTWLKREGVRRRSPRDG